MSQNRAVAVAIVMAYFLGTLILGGGFDTIRTEYPSGAAANVSHNRPVRMCESQAVACVVAIVVVYLVSTVAPGGGLDTIRKDYPSGAAAIVSHNTHA